MAGRVHRVWRSDTADSGLYSPVLAPSVQSQLSRKGTARRTKEYHHNYLNLPCVRARSLGKEGGEKKELVEDGTNSTYEIPCRNVKK
jgi:hypothetical protein